LTIDATGRTRSLARRFEVKTGPRKPADLVAFKTHVRGASIAEDVCEIYSYGGGYGGSSRVEGGLFNVCFIASAADTKRYASDPELVLREVVFSNKQARKSLELAEVVEPWHAVPIERFGRGKLVPANGLIAVGDSAAFIDPFTGSGILLALESSRIASNAIIDNFSKSLDLRKMAADYRREYAAAFDSRLRVCSALRHAAFVPWLADVTIIALSLSTGLRKRLARATRLSAGPAA
jgi:flavin-dependent dehydrogenase